MGGPRVPPKEGYARGETVVVHVKRAPSDAIRSTAVAVWQLFVIGRDGTAVIFVPGLALAQPALVERVRRE
jgi:hypothetical protein